MGMGERNRTIYPVRRQVEGMGGNFSTKHLEIASLLFYNAYTQQKRNGNKRNRGAGK